LKKEKIAILIRGEEHLRNFVKSGSFKRLEDACEVNYVVSNEIKIDDLSLFGGKIITHDFDKKNYVLRRILKELFVFRAIVHSSSYANYFSAPGKRKYLYKILSLRWIHVFLVWSFEIMIPLDKILVQKIKDISPLVLLMPVSSPGNVEYDMVKAVRKLGIKFGIIPVAWDNVSSKLFLYLTPDFVLERGPQNAEFARKIFALDEKKVGIIGVPHYEMYFKYQARTDLEERRRAFLEKQGISPDKKVFLFAGSLRPFDETSFLKEMDDAIEGGLLPNTHVIYRPHPEREARISEKSFFDEKFKHITFDEELKWAYLYPEKGYSPKLDNYLDLYNAIAALIGPPSSLWVEVALFNKPVLGLVCEDGVHFAFTSAQVLFKREHFKVWDNFDWFVACHKKEDFMDGCMKIMQIEETPGIQDKIRKDMHYLVYHDSKDYSQRIIDFINNYNG